MVPQYVFFTSSALFDTQYLELVDLLPPEARKATKDISTNGACACFHKGTTIWDTRHRKEEINKIRHEITYPKYPSQSFRNSCRHPRWVVLLPSSSLFSPIIQHKTTQTKKGSSALQLWDVSSMQMLKSHDLSVSDQRLALWQFLSNEKLSFVTSNMECFLWRVDKASKPFPMTRDESKEDIGLRARPHSPHQKKKRRGTLVDVRW